MTSTAPKLFSAAHLNQSATAAQPTPLADISWPVVVSYGGGDNSRAMLIEMVRREVRPDLILFADTGGEMPETYDNNAQFSAWLLAQGWPEITVVSDGRRTLEEECLEANTMPSLVFGFRSCSDKYKVRPQNRYVVGWQPAREAWAAGARVVKLIGYHAGEPWRVKDYNDARFVVEYPLVRWGWNSAKCIEVVRAAGFPPGKSACFFCPARRKHEVIDMARRKPELFARCVKMEQNATAATTAKGLGRNWSWEALVAADSQQQRLFDDLPDEVPCGCFDGGNDDGAEAPAPLKTNVREGDAPPQAVTDAAPGGSQPDSVACSAWLEPLAESWERRLWEICQLKNPSDAGRYNELQKCLDELRAGMESGSNVEVRH